MSGKKNTADRLQQLHKTMVVVGDSFKADMLQSFSEQYKSRKRLSARQMKLLDEWETDYDEAYVKTFSHWKEDYAQSSEHQSLFKLAIAYYKGNPPYFRNVVLAYEEWSLCEESKYSDNPYIPSYGTFKKMTDNHYFHRYKDILESAPLFKQGDLVEGRQGKGFSGNLYLVCKDTGNARAAKGSREYLVLLLTCPDYTSRWESRNHNRGTVHTVEEGKVKKFKLKGKSI